LLVVHEKGGRYSTFFINARNEESYNLQEESLHITGLLSDKLEMQRKDEIERTVRRLELILLWGD